MSSDPEAVVSEIIKMARAETETRAETVKTWKTDMSHFAGWVEDNDESIFDLSADDIEYEYFLDMKNEGVGESVVAPATIRSRYASLRALYTRLCKRDKYPIDETPMDDVDVSNWANNETMKSRMSDKFPEVSSGDFEAMCDEVPRPKWRNELLLRFLYVTGCRAGEVGKVKMDDIDRVSGEVEIPTLKKKDRGETRTVQLDSTIELPLRRWADDGYRDRFASAEESPYLFVTRKSPSISNDSVNDVVVKAAENAGVQDVMYDDARGYERKRITAHTLRHSAAKRMLRNGMSVPYVADILGHDKLETTRQYLQDTNEDAVNAQRDIHQQRGSEWTGI